MNKTKINEKVTDTRCDIKQLLLRTTPVINSHWEICLSFEVSLRNTLNSLYVVTYNSFGLEDE